MIQMQTCQIISGPAPKRQQAKEEARYPGTKYIMNSLMYSPEKDAFKPHLVYRWRMAASHTRCLQRVAYALQESPKEELQRLQKQWILVALSIDKTSEWCNSFELVPKLNGKARFARTQLGLTKHYSHLCTDA